MSSDLSEKKQQSMLAVPVLFLDDTTHTFHIEVSDPRNIITYVHTLIVPIHFHRNEPKVLRCSIKSSGTWSYARRTTLVCSSSSSRAM